MFLGMIDEVNEDMVVEEMLEVVLKLKWFLSDAATIGDRAGEKSDVDIERSCSRSGKLN